MLHSKHSCKNVFRQPHPKPVEPNPKILPFEKLVENIDEKVLAYYLEQISLFLKNTKKDLWFPKLTPYLDAFLVRVIRDVQNMQNLLDTFDSKSRAFAEDIIDSLNQNENVYNLTYSYEHSRIEADTLVYRKVFYPRGSKPMVTKNSESLYVQNDKPPRKDISWVKATHLFVTDSNCTLLEYPVMGYSEAELIYSVVKLQCKDVSHLGPLCEDLVDAIKDLNETMDLKATYLYISSKEVQLSIEKKPRISNGVECNLQMPVRNIIKQPDVEKPTNPKNDPKTKAEKALLNRKQLIDSLSKAFINTTLKTIFNFISTESEASLLFKNANENQRMFIQSACAMARAPKFYGLFANDSRQILKDIAKVITANQWYELRVDVSKAQKDKLRTVSFVKHPKESYETKSLPKPKTKVDSANSSFSARSKSLDRKNLPKKAIAFESGGKLEQVIGGIVDQPNKEQTPSETEAKQSDKNNSTKNPEETPQNVAKDNKTQPNEKENLVPSLPDINASTAEFSAKLKTRPSRSEHKDQSADAKRAKSVPPQNFDKDNGKQKVDGKKLCMSKLKLLQAMSIPMESDIAMRMMNQMGWDGGPLGLRGEGITEPIIPALHLAPKAGLGHVKADNKAAAGFKLDILQHLLLLLTQEALEHKVEYEKPLSNPEVKYIVDTVKMLNNRKKINEGEGQIKMVIGGIMEELFCEPDVQISCDVKTDKKHVTLNKKIIITKGKTTTLPNDRDKVVMQHCTNLPKIISTDNAKAIGVLYDKSTALKTGLRIILQYTVMDFLKINLMERTIKFSFDVPKKSINFLNAFLVRINQRSCANQNTNSSIEHDFYREALKYSKGTEITMNVDNLRSFTMRKTVIQTYPPQTCMELTDLANNNSNIVNKNKDLVTANTTQGKVKNNDNNTDITKQASNKTDENADINKQASNITDDMKNATENLTITVTDISHKINEEIEKNATENLTITVTDNSHKINEEIEKNATENLTMTDNCLEIIHVENHDNATCIDYEDSSNNDSFELKDMENEIKYLDNLVSSFKRNRSESQSSSNAMKKTKITDSVTYFLITPKSGNKISNDEVKKFQTTVAEQIDLSTNLPKLECHGVKHGGIVYGSHNDIGAKLIESVASKMEFTTKVQEKFSENNRRKLKIRLNSSIGINLKKFLNLIECYNIGLYCDDWALEDVDVFDDFIVISVEVDNASFQYILEANFRLFAGTDRLRISLAWD